ncbi:integrase arm-type DNA-binding domain-containing protein [uncultured Haemophilus sp.]|uniref:integrase arm-type DNA-binding domain-containing protein n=1 Tax=uncultured Haemophilus sp. TaxID=237779 RepID=UPI0026264908|nr:integrase arm-type DNA-binding domain-containing protein [uncultured Haemophilus sp.]
MRKILLPFYEIPTMAKIIKQLTIAQVNNAKAAEKIYYLFDGEGLKLVVKPNGVKTWVFNYKRPYTLKRTEKTIGTFPAVSLKDARQKAFEFRQLLANKIDPHEFEQKQAAEALKEQCSTFAVVVHIVFT